MSPSALYDISEQLFKCHKSTKLVHTHIEASQTVLDMEPHKVGCQSASATIFQNGRHFAVPIPASTPRFHFTPCKSHLVCPNMVDRLDNQLAHKKKLMSSLLYVSFEHGLS